MKKLSTYSNLYAYFITIKPRAAYEISLMYSKETKVFRVSMLNDYALQVERTFKTSYEAKEFFRSMYAQIKMFIK